VLDAAACGGLSLPQGPAEQFGCFDAVRTQITRHRTERACYRPALRIVDQHPAAIAVEEVEAYLWPPEAPPDDEGETLMDLLHRELGAYPIGTG
jgi:hypothetical protein